VYKEDDSLSAKPGFSEHQTGYAIDISTRTIGISDRFEKTAIYEWLRENCFKYGFILRYPKEKSNLTGYCFEPWHFRYAGNIAEEIDNKQLTLEEYLISNTEI
jgi:D-alanyl-D-alanine carboxypeptidase